MLFACGKTRQVGPYQCRAVRESYPLECSGREKFKSLNYNREVMVKLYAVPPPTGTFA